MRYMSNTDLGFAGILGGTAWAGLTALGWLALGTYLLNEHIRAKQRAKDEEEYLCHKQLTTR